jgi:hypothetical protein
LKKFENLKKFEKFEKKEPPEPEATLVPGRTEWKYSAVSADSTEPVLLISRSWRDGTNLFFLSSSK